MPERWKPIVTDLDPSNALDRLVVAIDVLRNDVDLHVEDTIDATGLVKLTYSGTSSGGFSIQRGVPGIFGGVVRLIWNGDFRDYEIA